MRNIFLSMVVVSSVICEPLHGIASGDGDNSGNEFAHFGVERLSPPGDGWKRVVEGGTGHIARWARFGQDGTITTIITLELEPAKGRTAEQYAVAMVRERGGTAEPSDLAIDSEKAYRITNARAGNMRTEALVAGHGDYLYVIGGFAAKGNQPPRGEMESLAKALKFRPMTDPSAFTALRGDKFPLFGKILIEPLATMRPNPEPPPKGQVGVSVYNFAARHVDFTLNIDLIPNPNGAALAAFQKAYESKLTAPGDEVVWTKLGEKPESVITSTFTASAAGKNVKMRAGLVLLPRSNDVVLLTFTFPNIEPKAVAAYEKASSQIVRSIVPIKKANE